MTVIRCAVCEYCHSKKRKYEELVDEVSFEYQKIVGEQKPSFESVDGWTVKARPAEDDAIAVTYEFYCDDCTRLDRAFDSGDRKV